MWFIGVEVEQETSAPSPEKNPGSVPVFTKIMANGYLQFVILELGSVESADMLCSTSFFFSLSMLASKLEKSTEKPLLNNHGREKGGTRIL